MMRFSAYQRSLQHWTDFVVDSLTPLQTGEIQFARDPWHHGSWKADRHGETRPLSCWPSTSKVLCPLRCRENSRKLFLAAIARELVDRRAPQARMGCKKQHIVQQALWEILAGHLVISWEHWFPKLQVEWEGVVSIRASCCTSFLVQNSSYIVSPLRICPSLRKKIFHFHRCSTLLLLQLLALLWGCETPLERWERSPVQIWRF